MASRTLCACVLTLSAVAGARAVEPAAVDEGAIALDQTVQALKDEVIQFNRDALIAEEAFLYPPVSRLSVYVSNRLKNLLLKRIDVVVDDRAPVVYQYGERDSRALLEPGALQRLVLTNVDRGAHRIRVVYSGHFVDGDEQLQIVTDKFEAVIDKGADAAEIELQLQRGSGRRSAVMTLKEWRAAEE